MTRDLERIQTLASEVRSTPTDLFGEPFPLPLFKHVAVECLNAASSSSEEPARPEKTPGTKDELECAPRFTDRLTSKLEAAAPASKSDALSLLRDLDEFQSLRLKLRTRIAKIADIVEANRNFLATRRAQLRKLRQRWRERRPEISRPRWRELQNNFEQLADDLDELERQTDQIEDQARAWPDTVDDANRAMYFTITSDWKRPSEG